MNEGQNTPVLAPDAEKLEHNPEVDYDAGAGQYRVKAPEGLTLLTTRNKARVGWTPSASPATPERMHWHLCDAPVGQSEAMFGWRPEFRQDGPVVYPCCGLAGTIDGDHWAQTEAPR